MAFIHNYVEVAIVLLVMLSVLVAAHELGHYPFARLFNMGVEEFSIGMGKRVALLGRRPYIVPILPGTDPVAKSLSEGSVLEGGKMVRMSELIETPSGPALREETDFSIRSLPIGGYVRIKGMMPEEDGSEVRIPGGFYSKPPWQRLVVLFAGPLFSVLAGILILVPLYMTVGAMRPNPSPEISGIVTGGAANKAKLQAGDLFVSINGTPIREFYDARKIIDNSDGAPLKVVVSRKGKLVSTVVRPEQEKTAEQVVDKNLIPTGEYKRHWVLGVVPLPLERRRLNLPDALVEAVNQPIFALRGLASIVRYPSHTSDNVGGPVEIVQISQVATQAGPTYVLELSAMLSISLGIMNLLPIVPLDGGQMTVSLAEMLRGGKRLSIQVQGLLSTIGLTLVLLIVIGTTYIDVKRIVSPPEPPIHGKILRAK